MKKTLIGVAALAMTGLGGCAVYAPAPVVYGPGFVVGPAPLYVGGYYPHRYGYFGYYGWHRGYWR